MSPWFAALALWSAWLAGCGDDAGSGPVDGPPPDANYDAPVDAPPLDRDACPASYVPSFIVGTINVPTPDVGFDLNGDTVVDNELSQIRLVLNPILRDSIQQPPFLIITVESLEDPQNDPDVAPVIYQAIDADGDPTNDWSGSGQFWFLTSSVDWQCHPLATLPAGQLVAGHYSAQGDMASIPLPLATFVVKRAHLSGTIPADLSGLPDVLVGGAATPCPLSHARQSLTNQTVLDLLVANFNLQPDIDLDGDGLERYLASPSAGVYACFDGDGTRIDGVDCPCDPRMSDGFSLALELSAVKAELLGPTPVDAGVD